MPSDGLSRPRASGDRYELADGLVISGGAPAPVDKYLGMATLDDAVQVAREAAVPSTLSRSTSASLPGSSR